MQTCSQCVWGVPSAGWLLANRPSTQLCLLKSCFSRMQQQFLHGQRVSAYGHNGTQTTALRAGHDLLFRLCKENREERAALRSAHEQRPRCARGQPRLHFCFVPREKRAACIPKVRYRPKGRPTKIFVPRRSQGWPQVRSQRGGTTHTRDRPKGRPPIDFLAAAPARVATAQTMGEDVLPPAERSGARAILSPGQHPIGERGFE